jgi:hypothetical protein
MLYKVVEHHMGDRADQDHGEGYDKQKLAERLTQQNHPQKHANQCIQIDFSEYFFE